MQWYTSALGQRYTSLLLMYTFIGGNKQSLEGAESKQSLNCAAKQAQTHMNALRRADNQFLSGWRSSINYRPVCPHHGFSVI